MPCFFLNHYIIPSPCRHEIQCLFEGALQMSLLGRFSARVAFCLEQV